MKKKECTKTNDRIIIYKKKNKKINVDICMDEKHIDFNLYKINSYEEFNKIVKQYKCKEIDFIPENDTVTKENFEKGIYSIEEIDLPSLHYDYKELRLHYLVIIKPHTVKRLLKKAKNIINGIEKEVE